MKSLYDALHVEPPEGAAGVVAPSAASEPLPEIDSQTFCKQILSSPEFRTYLLNGILLGDLPPAIITRIMDHGWGRPPERVEHTGKDGQPIVTEVRRRIVRVDEVVEEDESERSVTTH